MILYFSATGNTQYVARTLARLLNDECLDLLPRLKSGDCSALHSQRPFVVCAPVYVSEMPRFLSAWLRRAALTGNQEVYFLFTNGGYAGIAGAQAAWLSRKKGMIYKGCAELVLPGNYIASNLFPAGDREETERRIAAVHSRLPALAEAIRSGQRLKSRHVWLLETLLTVPFNPVWCRLNQPTAPFFVTEGCVSCGQCARRCPVNAITMVRGRPLWTKDRCAHCMACIQNCPAQAIEYGPGTEHKERYLFQKYQYVLKRDEERRSP